LAARPGVIVRTILAWSYERGTLQYDIICALILAFIFFVPRSCFESKRIESPTSKVTTSGSPAAVEPTLPAPVNQQRPLR